MKAVIANHDYASKFLGIYAQAGAAAKQPLFDNFGRAFVTRVAQKPALSKQPRQNIIYHKNTMQSRKICCEMRRGTENYIDLLPILGNLYIPAESFLSDIKEVKIKNEC